MCVDKYQPITCTEYDVYEISIMRNALLNLQWFDASGIEHNKKVKPVGLKIIEAAEYLIVELKPDDTTSIAEIRLDKIIKAK